MIYLYGTFLRRRSVVLSANNTRLGEQTKNNCPDFQQVTKNIVNLFGLVEINVVYLQRQNQ